MNLVWSGLLVLVALGVGDMSLSLLVVLLDDDDDDGDVFCLGCWLDPVTNSGWDHLFNPEASSVCSTSPSLSSLLADEVANMACMGCLQLEPVTGFFLGDWSHVR